jgi:nitrate reductase NapE component
MKPWIQSPEHKKSKAKQNKKPKKTYAAITTVIFPVVI